MAIASLGFLLVACGGGGGPDAAAASVSVYASLQDASCVNTGIPLPVLQRQLAAAGVQATDPSCGYDGVSRSAVCGAYDGAIGIFEVPSQQVAAAAAAGFQPLAALPRASRAACPSI